MSERLTPETRAWLEQATGAPLARPALWAEALTHGSLGEERDYQRLEFLGDRVLGLTVASILFERGRDAEGKLSQRLNVLVSREMCATIARQIGLGPHIRMGRQANDDGGRESDNILGDVTEALIGAAYLERGFEGAATLIRKWWADAFSGEAGASKHPKSALQEWAAGNRRRTPEYRLIDRQGPDHAARFIVSVSVRNVGEAEGVGSSKQEAETAAAQAFMERYG